MCRGETEAWRLAQGRRGAGAQRGGRLRFSLDDFLLRRCREPSWRAVRPSRAGRRTSLREQVTRALGSKKVAVTLPERVAWGFLGARRSSLLAGTQVRGDGHPPHAFLTWWVTSSSCHRPTWPSSFLLRLPARQSQALLRVPHHQRQPLTLLSVGAKVASGLHSPTLLLSPVPAVSPGALPCSPV